MRPRDLFWKKQRVIVTGHEGFLGANLAVKLSETGAKVYGIDISGPRKFTVTYGTKRKFKSFRADIADRTAIRRIVRNVRPTVVMHLAAEAIVTRAKEDPANVFRTNIAGTWNLLEALREIKGLSAVIVASSDKAYGTKARLPYREDDALCGQHPYDVSKSCEDLIALSYYHTFSLPVCVMRCGNIYGPGDHNFSRLIPDAIRCGIKKEKFVVRSDGKFTRDYVYVDDVCLGYMLAAEKMRSGKIAGLAFNLSNEKPLSVLEVLAALGKRYGDNVARPRILGKASCEIVHQYLSSARIKRVMGWKHTVSFSKGLDMTADWYERRIG